MAVTGNETFDRSKQPAVLNNTSRAKLTLKLLKYLKFSKKKIKNAYFDVFKFEQQKS